MEHFQIFILSTSNSLRGLRGCFPVTLYSQIECSSTCALQDMLWLSLSLREHRVTFSTDIQLSPSWSHLATATHLVLAYTNAENNLKIGRLHRRSGFTREGNGLEKNKASLAQSDLERKCHNTGVLK